MITVPLLSCAFIDSDSVSGCSKCHVAGEYVMDLVVHGFPMRSPSVFLDSDTKK